MPEPEEFTKGADDLARLAASLGYASHGHLTERLRRALGSPPSRIRALMDEHETGVLRRADIPVS